MKKEETSGEKTIGTSKVQERSQNSISYRKNEELPECLGGGIPFISFRDSCPPCCHLSLQEQMKKLLTTLSFLSFPSPAPHLTSS